MPPGHSLPEVNAIRHFLTDLLGRPVAVQEGKPVSLPPKEACVVAEYADDQGSAGALCICDLPLAIRVGAALSLLPPGVAEASIRVNRPNEAIADNLHEVFNVTSHLLNVPGTAHVGLRNVYLPDNPAPKELRSQMGAALERLDVEASIHGYGSGKMTLLRFSPAAS